MGDVCDPGLRALESFVFPENWASAVVFTWKGASVADPTLASSTARHHEHCAAPASPRCRPWWSAHKRTWNALQAFCCLLGGPEHRSAMTSHED